MNERKLQTEIIGFLKAHGAYVIKTRPGMGTPAGCPDLFAFYGPLFAAIECKASAKAPYRAGQEATLAYLRRSGRGGRFVYTTYPENWQEIKADLLANFF
jgi:Holliday junction resolvase